MGYEATRAEAKQRMAEKNYTEARKLFLQAAEEEGLPLEDWLEHSEVLLKEGRIPEAALGFMRVIRGNPTDIDALLGAARCALAVQETQQAGQLVRAALSLDSDNGVAHTLQGILYEIQKDPGEALREFEIGFEKNPDVFLCAYNYGRLLSQTEQVQKALAILLKASQIQPFNYDVHYILGIVYVQSGNTQKALESFHQAAKLDPKRINIYSTLADVYLQIGEPEQAISCLKEALESAEPQVSLLLKLADILNHLGQHAEALNYLDQATDLEEDNASAWVSLGQTYTLLEHYSEAQDAITTALRLSPESWEAHSAAGILYSALEQWEQAEMANRRAAELAPEEFTVLGNLAALLIEKGNNTALQEAIQLLRRTISLAPPEELRFHFNLALAYIRMGNTKNALPLLEVILRKVPKDEPLHQAAQTLKENTTWS